MAKPEETQPPVKSAEGTDLPPLAATVDADAPTLADYQHEWGQYIAVMDIPYGTATAVAKGGAVPASHPLLTEWLEAGLAAPVPVNG